jgi:hypothetical protein
VLGGKCRVLDVWTPSLLVLRAPAFCYPPHELLFSLLGGRSSPRPKGRRTLIGRRAAPTEQVGDSVLVFDCRHDSSANVAHVLQNQIGVALWALRALGIEERWRDLLFVLSPETPEYAVALFRALGFRTLCSWGEVSGQLLRMHPQKFPLRSVAAEVLRTHAARLGIVDEGEPVDDGVFLSRRGRRTLTNMEQVEPLVNAAGCRTVFLEDLPAAEQIRTVASARLVFGLHGAGMGFILFRNPTHAGVVIECFSSGFATNWARANATATGSVWIGGQGDLDPPAIRHMQRGAHSHAHEADNYRLDPETVQRLLRLVEVARADPVGLDSCSRLERMLAVRPDVISLRPLAGSMMQGSVV